MKDKEKYFKIIEHDIIKNIYDEAIEGGNSYFDTFIKLSKNYNDLEPHIELIKRSIMANDAETLVYLVVANKIVKMKDKLYVIINNEIKDKLDDKMALDIVRILISNGYVSYALKIMTSEYYYKVHFLEDLKFLDESKMNYYLFGQNDLPVYFINQFNDFELEQDKEEILDRLIVLYGTILDEIPKYYHSYYKDDVLDLEYPSDATKRDKKVTFRFIDLSQLVYDGSKLATLKRIDKKIKDLVRR